MALGGSILTWFDGRWTSGNVPILGAADHGTWQGTLVFDGARAFEGVTPDLDLHCDRLIRSAEAMGLAPPVGARRFERAAEGGNRLVTEPRERPVERPRGVGVALAERRFHERRDIAGRIEAQRQREPLARGRVVGVQPAEQSNGVQDVGPGAR